MIQPSPRYLSNWRSSEPVENAADGNGWAARLAETQLRMAWALSCALELRDPPRELVQHGTRVAILARAVAEGLGVSQVELEHVESAAQLHEIGMIGVPRELLERPDPLSEEERGWVRAHAHFGAEIVRITHDDAVARLIEHQYENFCDLLTREELSSRDILLTGILRTVDVYDAMHQARPYRKPLSRRQCHAHLREGAGSLYHPLAVDKLLRTEGMVAFGFGD